MDNYYIGIYINRWKEVDYIYIWDEIGIDEAKQRIESSLDNQAELLYIISSTNEIAIQHV